MKITEEERMNRVYEKQLLREEKVNKEIQNKDNRFYEKEHSKYLNTLEKIASGELKVNLNMIASFIASQLSTEENKFKGVDFFKAVKIYDKANGFVTGEFKDELKKVLFTKYIVSSDQVSILINRLIMNPRLNYLYDEYKESSLKQDIITMEENYISHKKVVKDIINTFDEESLPKIGYGVINLRIVYLINQNVLNIKFNNDDINKIRTSYHDINFREVIKSICKKYYDTDRFSEEIYQLIIKDEKLKYLMEEYNLINKQKEVIAFNNHEINMEKIRRATRIREISEFKESALNSYLNGNTTIYTNDDRIKTDDLKVLVTLLLNGYKWESQEIIDEIDRITLNIYPDKKDASKLLLNKLSKLSKTYYLVEEINFAKEREKTILSLDFGKLYTYHVEDKKNSKNGGVFVRIYLSAKSDLDLSLVIDKVSDLDSLENYVKEHLDSSFVAVGAMILCRDEFKTLKDNSRDITIYNFKQNTGLEEVDKETKKKIDLIESLDAEISKREVELENMLNNLNEIKRIISKVYNHFEEDTMGLNLLKK